MKYTKRASIPEITQKVLLSEEGNRVILVNCQIFSLFLVSPIFLPIALFILSPFVSVSFFAVMINKHKHLCQFIYSGGGGRVLLFKQDIFSLIWGGRIAERALAVFFIQAARFFFCGSMLFVSVTIDGVIPFHSVVWLCPIMPTRTVSACPPLGRQEGDCWARQSPFSH